MSLDISMKVTKPDATDEEVSILNEFWRYDERFGIGENGLVNSFRDLGRLVSNIIDIRSIGVAIVRFEACELGHSMEIQSRGELSHIAHASRGECYICKTGSSDFPKSADRSGSGSGRSGITLILQ